ESRTDVRNRCGSLATDTSFRREPIIVQEGQDSGRCHQHFGNSSTVLHSTIPSFFSGSFYFRPRLLCRGWAFIAMIGLTRRSFLILLRMGWPACFETWSARTRI